MIIDFHAHIYPEKIAEKATLSISKFYENKPMSYNGLSNSLVANGKKSGITNFVVHSAATKASQVESVNDFIINEVSRHTEFIGFGTIHPEYANYEEELIRIKNAGLKGVKIHPDFQNFQADTEKMDPIYDKLTDLQMVVLFHAGDYRYDRSSPERILNVNKKHPEMKMVAAHFGGYTEWDASEKILSATNIYFDTSSSLFALSAEKAVRMINKHGIDKFLFGSDFPMWNFDEEIQRIKNLGLSEEDNEKIFYKNAAFLLGLK